MSVRRQSKRPATQRFALNPAELGAALAEILPVGDGADPLTVDGWYDNQGRPRRLRADYANGWRIEVRLSVDLKVTSRSASFRLVTKAGTA